MGTTAKKKRIRFNIHTLIPIITLNLARNALKMELTVIFTFNSKIKFIPFLFILSYYYALKRQRYMCVHIVQHRTVHTHRINQNNNEKENKNNKTAKQFYITCHSNNKFQIYPPKNG